MFLEPDNHDGEDDAFDPLKKKPKTFIPWSARDVIVAGIVLLFLAGGILLSWKIISTWDISRSDVGEPTFSTAALTKAIAKSATEEDNAFIETDQTPAGAITNETPTSGVTITSRSIANPILPLPLFLIARFDGIDQVWRLERDGSTLIMITHEDNPVTALDVSPVTGDLAYVSGNQLILADADGSNRRVLVAGDAVVPGSPQWVGRQQISSPLWSSDGMFLAYGLNGINLMTMENGNVKILSQNIVPEKKGDQQEFFYPAWFSPRGSLLFAEVLYEEGNSLRVFPTIEGDSFELPGVKACCQFSFSNDLRQVTIGSGWDIANDFGLWRYDMYEDKVETLIKADEPTGKNTHTVIQFPKEMPDGRIIYFYGQSENPLEVQLSLVAAQADGYSDRYLVRSDSYTNIREAIWAPDASFVIIRTAYKENLLFLTILDIPASILPIMGHHLRWGVLQ